MRLSSAKSVLLWVSMFFLTSAIAGSSQQPEEARDNVCQGDDSIPTMVWFMKLRQGISIGGLDQRDVPRLGDSVSVSLLKLYTEEELLQPKTLQRALQGIREAFSSPCSIALPSDKVPSVTGFLLTNLERRIEDKTLRGQVLDTLAYVKQQTAAMHCEEPETSGKVQLQAPAVASSKPKPQLRERHECIA